MKILTFNWHEAYLHLLAKTGYELDVVKKMKAGLYGWIEALRPVPHNCRLISEDEARAGLQAGQYDRVIAHNIDDLVFAHNWQVPTILVFHNKLTTEIALSKTPVDRNDYLEKVSRCFNRIENLTLVFISEAKRLDWGFSGKIILPGIDPEEYGGYTGEAGQVLRIGNGLVERDIMLGYSVQERLLAGLPSTILGLNAHIPQAVIPPDWDTFRGFLRTSRVYLNTTLAPFEDGYNLAMLEAMTTGMPVVSAANGSSPIEDGVNGFISEDETYLRERIEMLLGDPGLSRSMGCRARETVLERFPVQRFVDNWKSVIETGHCVRGLPTVRIRTESPGKNNSDQLPDTSHPGQGAVVSVGEQENQKKRQGLLMKDLDAPAGLKILMSYTSNPQTTAAYMEKALRKHHDVITFGPSISKEILRQWDLETLRDRVKDHDIPYFTDDLGEVVRHLPQGWQPDLFLWVESGLEFPLKGFDALPCPSACYLVDTHLNLEKHLETALSYDHVFLAQRKYIPRFREMGTENINWLPLACDPDTHRQFKGDKCYELSFVGSITPSNKRRNHLLMRLAERFPLHVERCFLEDMSQVFSRSKIVFNCSVKDDLNMRVFEAMSTGSLLITDQAPGSGLTEMFEHGNHLVLYKDRRDLFEQVAYYLNHETERERIAAEGRRELLALHTYGHRVEAIIRVLVPLGSICDDPPGEIAEKHSPEKPKYREAPAQMAAAGQCDEEVDSLPEYFKSERREVVDLVPETAVRVLDVGCGGGYLGKGLKQLRGDREVWGLEKDPRACGEAKKWLDQVVLADADRWDPPDKKGYFDTLVFADVLEHFPDPERVLQRTLPLMSATGAVAMSIPNIRFWSAVVHLADQGNWTYQDEGLLDRSHLRFFTWKEILRLLDACNLEVKQVLYNIDKRCPAVPDGQTIDLDLGRLIIRDLSAEEVREFFVFQYLVLAVRKKEWLQAEAEQLEAAGRAADAFEIYATLAERYPDEPGFIKEMVRNAPAGGAMNGCLDLIEKHLQLHPADLDMLVVGARLLKKNNQFEKAGEYLHRVLLFVPDHVEARTGLDQLSGERDALIMQAR